MSPILVPTIAELGIELERSVSALHAALAAENVDASLSFAGCASDQHTQRVMELIREIAELPAASIADLRIKARGLAHWQAGSSLDDERWPIEEKLSRQIVAGLIDERIC